MNIVELYPRKAYMSDYLIAPLEGVIQGICIDDRRTRVCDDMTRFTHKGGMTQVDITCLLPPDTYVLEKKIIEALQQQLQIKEDSSFFQFLSKRSKIDFSLDEKEPKKVLVASYVLDEKNKLIYEELSTTSAIATMLNYEDYSKTADCLKRTQDLLKIIKEKPELRKFVDFWKNNSFRKGNNDALHLVAMSINLFNATCREAARRKQLTFIEGPRPSIGKHYFTKSGDYAVFNRVLRDPTAFINSTNLASYFEGKPVVYSAKFLKENLGNSLF